MTYIKKGHDGKKLNGGKREGAGRKKAQHTIETEMLRARMIEKIAKDFDPIIDAQIESAKGLWYEDEGKKVYRMKPDTQTGQYLLNQSAGKAKDTVDLNTKVNVIFNE